MYECNILPTRSILTLFTHCPDSEVFALARFIELFSFYVCCRFIVYIDLVYRFLSRKLSSLVSYSDRKSGIPKSPVNSLALGNSELRRLALPQKWSMFFLRFSSLGLGWQKSKTSEGTILTRRYPTFDDGTACPPTRYMVHKKRFMIAFIFRSLQACPLAIPKNIRPCFGKEKFKELVTDCRHE